MSYDPWGHTPWEVERQREESRAALFVGGLLALLIGLCVWAAM